MSTLTVGRRLTTTQLTRFLSRIFDTPAWVDKAEHLVVSLERVEWVDLGAVCALLAVLQRKVLAGSHLEVIMPSSELLPGEVRFLTSPQGQLSAPSSLAFVRAAAQRRGRAAAFLRYQGLREAIAHPAFAGRAIMSDRDERGGTPREYTFRFDFGLKWLSPGDPQGVRAVEAFFSGVLSEKSRGLSRELAKAIANVFLWEVLDNVKTHSGLGDWCLVAASVRDTEFVKGLKPEDFHPQEWKYLQWLEESAYPVVEIVAADGGLGVASTLGGEFDRRQPRWQLATSTRESNILAWAFDRHSTSRPSREDRGVRGLFRLHRTIRRRQGFVSLQSGRSLVSWDHGGLGYESLADLPTLPPLPGTVVRALLPVLREPDAYLETPGRFRERPESRLGQPAMYRADAVLPSVEWEGENLLTASWVGVLPARERDDRAYCMDLLRFLATNRPPRPAVVFPFSGGWDLVSGCVDSLNEEAFLRRAGDESHAAEHYEAWDSLAVFGHHGECAWISRTPGEVLALNALARGAAEQHVEALLTLAAVEPGIVTASQNGFTLRTPASLSEAVGGLVDARIRDGSPGIFPGPIGTPSLTVVAPWITMDTLIQQCGGAEIVAMGLAALVRSAFPSLRPGCVLAPRGAQSTESLLNLVAEILGGVPIRVGGDTSIPPEVRAGSEALLFCEVVESGETCKQMITECLRRKVLPQLVVTVVDGRATPTSPLRVWDSEVRVVALCRRPLGAPGVEPTTFIDLGTRRPDAPSLELPAIVADMDRARWLPTIHFSHVGDRLGRHFTFYADTNRLAADRGIATTVAGMVRDWEAASEGELLIRDRERCEVWFPDQPAEPYAPARALAHLVAEEMGESRISLRGIPRELGTSGWIYPTRIERLKPGTGVVVLDWGALSGTTLLNLIELAAEAGAASVLACVLLSQMSDDLRNFVARVTRLRVRLGEPSGVQRTLFDVPSPTQTQVVPASVRFLGRAQTGVYDIDHCPVCIHLERLSREPLPGRLLQRFGARRFQTFRQRKRSEVATSGPVDLWDYPLKRDVVDAMSGLRSSLVAAEGSTERRWHLRRLLEGLNADGDESRVQCEALVRLLAIETQWLKRQPLRLEILRERVASIAIAMAQRPDVVSSVRISAVIVLRSASRYAFARSVSTLLRATSSVPEERDQVLFSVATLLQRAYVQNPEVLRDLERELPEGLRMLGGTGPDLAQAIELLLHRTRTEIAAAGAAHISPAEAARSLRTRLDNDERHDHDSVASESSKAVAFVRWLRNAEAPSEERPNLADFARAARRCWDRCVSWFDTELLPYLRILPPMESPASPELRELLTLLSPLIAEGLPGIRVVESEVFDCLDQAATSESAPIWGTAVSSALERVEKYDTLIFRRLSVFRRRLGSLGASVATALAEAAPREPAGADRIAGGIDAVCEDLGPTLVFCPARLLSDAFAVLIQNAVTHEEEGQRSSLEISIRAHTDVVTITFRYLNTTEQRRRGRGLTSIQERLRPFGGLVYQRGRSAESDNAYEIDVHLPEVVHGKTHFDR